MTELILHLADGTVISVPASLDAITTYILLEQEAWFEKETAILDWFGPGATAIDIGANLGVYCLPLARRAAPDGHVFAYEPASETRAHLERSRALNGLDNLHIIPAAVSDAAREGRLVFSYSGELHRLGENGTREDGKGESVTIVSLDAEARARDWRRIDFVKIDAEGEEHRILDGGHDFFARFSPLVMFECKDAEDIDHAIADRFRAMGYGVYRLLYGAPLLVPVAPGETLDRHQINLFAAKPDRARQFAREDRLVETLPPPWQPSAEWPANASELLKAQPFASAFPQLFADTALDPKYRDALAGYAAWRSANEAPERYAALRFAYGQLRELCESAASPARLATLARAAWDLGLNTSCAEALHRICRLGQQGQGTVEEPFWPPNPRFDAIAPGTQAGAWFIVSVAEQLERASAYSSIFFDGPFNLDWLAAQPFASVEMERRRMLKQLRAKRSLTVPARLTTPAPGHINAEVWRRGLVPNSLPPSD